MAVGLDEFQAKVVGPYLLQKTLGKGQTGKKSLNLNEKSYQCWYRLRTCEARGALLDWKNGSSKNHQQREIE